MAKVEKDIIICAPVDEVFSYVFDPRNAPQWLPGVLGVSEVVLSQQGVGSCHRWTYNMAGLRVKGKTVTKEYVVNRRIVNEGTGIVPNTWTYDFEEQGVVCTHLRLSVSYRIGLPLVGGILERLLLKQNLRVAVLAAERLKARLEY